MNDTTRIRLTDAQRSAIECRMHGDEQVDGLELDGRNLIVRDHDATFRALTEASNAEGDAAEYGTAGPDAPFARRAARALGNIAEKVHRLRPA